MTAVAAGAVIAIYSVALCYLARRSGQNLHGAVDARLRNSTLLKDLTAARRELHEQAEKARLRGCSGASGGCRASGCQRCSTLGEASGSGDISDTVDIPAGESVTYSVNATIDPAATGDLINTASVSTSVSDPNPGDDP